ncbi:hypothetical protein PLESTB_000081400 [Pleodorina starrii]|uniref:BACK domain-containing protein n=1 Tax=Pleodorina starrii TaxID=330485 RepID=A0A9W6BA12_9CHLO|nr:hypothetical protein PLESTM_000077800 [Pleodorina starrii]GLC48302.1 hypothetical protein PLESTB_000081400 [Pleodorina starrii]GLC66587.1 hypothetical protein PLESTF_000447200 [Pleodorina starrii]
MVNTNVAAALRSLFGKETDSDCVIIFRRAQCEGPTPNRLAGDGGCGETAAVSSAIGSSAAVSGSRSSPSSHTVGPAGAPQSEPQDRPDILGDPLPGHKIVLRHASEMFRAQLDWPTTNDTRTTVADNGHGDGHASGAADHPAAASASGCGAPPCNCTKTCYSSRGGGPRQQQPQRAQLVVPLSGEDELPSARAALEFAYSGQLRPGCTVRETLGVRRQAAYLQIDGCTAACDVKLLELMAQRDKDAVNGVGISSGRASVTAVTAAAAAAAALELYDCVRLWPDPDNEPDFTAVVAAARRLLVSYFRDALSVLNSPARLRRLLALPPVGLAALLESEEFGTDCESSVLLMLATWVNANSSRAGGGGAAADLHTRVALSRRVRLALVSRPHLTFLLSTLALAFEKSSAAGGEGAAAAAESGGGAAAAAWLPLTVLDAALLGRYAAADPTERAALTASVSHLYDFESPAFSLTPRPQCLPAAGRTLTWCVRQHDLLAQLEEPLDGGHLGVGAVIGDAAEFRDRFVWGGFEWTLVLMHYNRDHAAMLGMFCHLPSAFQIQDPNPLYYTLPSTVGSHVLLTVHVWEGGVQREVPVDSTAPSTCRLSSGVGWVWPKALPLQPQPVTAAAAAASNGGRAGGDGGGRQAAVAAWSRYLHGGHITGSLRLLAPPV